MRGEGWTTEGGTGEAGAAVQISVQPQAESTPVDGEAQQTLLLSNLSSSDKKNYLLPDERFFIHSYLCCHACFRAYR